MIESKSWFDYVIYVALVLLVGGLIWRDRKSVV